MVPKSDSRNKILRRYAAASEFMLCYSWLTSAKHDSLAERSKAVAQGAIPKGREFEPHSCHFLMLVQLRNYKDRKPQSDDAMMLGFVRFSCFENLLCQVEFWRAALQRTWFLQHALARNLLAPG